MGNLFSDIRYCLRGFARRPLFAVVVVDDARARLEHQRGDLLHLRPDTAARAARPGPGRARESRRRPGSSRATRPATTAAPATRFSATRCSAISSASTGRSSGIAAHRYVDASLAFEGETATGSGLLVSGQIFLAARRQAGAGPFARYQRRSRRRRGERRRVDATPTGNRRSAPIRRSSAARSSSTASR